ncbi:NAD(P)-binding domain-containing protein [Spongiactinospora sp. TRM90649]|uniref:NAD(P)-dependent oxidoreductase n=1 Tax=Spongiactinospora sp. TRM90649 TaxID=3031114 RepID=UPI0023F69505|nr:NAD(P)-binding domain-containing protein [Spongiactinospora sp. TRM90649]MDF5752968.1 NAD(P)-binding domain-containing protein [Spongiactinospora sp. TRM90649]
MPTDSPTDVSTDRTPVTVLGLGPMGRALAGAFLAAGHPTTVWNRTPGKAGDLAARGAVVAETPGEAVAAGDVVVVCVLDYDASQAILDRAAGDLKGRTLVNLTADTPDRARQAAEWAAGHGVRYLDGAIMTPTVTIGGPDAVFLLSGPEDLYEETAPVLAALGGTRSHLGADPGRAAAYDLALLDMFWTGMGGMLHGMALARAENVTAADLAPFAKGMGTLMAQVVDELTVPVDTRSHPGDDSTILSVVATLDHVVHTSERRGIDASLIRAVQEISLRAVAAGRGTDGFSGIVEFFDADAGTAR